MAFYKNVASQKVAFLALDSSLDPLTGDAANITAEISKDGGASTATNDANPTELEATDHPGIYVFDLTQAETNADQVVITPASSTSGVTFEPRSVVIYPTPGANTGIHSDVRLWKGTAPADLAGTDKVAASVQHIPDGAFTAAKFGANFLTAAGISQDAGEEIAAIVEEFIVNDGDATAVMQAIADKIAADWVAGDASPLAIVAALKADAEWRALDYDNAIWVNPDGGTDGSTNGTHGKRSAPCKTWANVASLLTARSLSKVRVVGSGTLTINTAISDDLEIVTGKLCTVLFTTGASISAASVSIEGWGTVGTNISLAIANLSVFRLTDVANVYGTYASTLGATIHFRRCTVRSSNLTFENESVTILEDCRSAAHSRKITSTKGHFHAYGWDGEIELDPSGTGHMHVSGRSDALTISGTSGSVALVGEIVIASESVDVTVDKSGITAKEGVDGDTLETLSDQIDGLEGGGGGGEGGVTNLTTEITHITSES
jgi:hypothetical protein